MRRDIRGHTNSNTASTIDQHIRIARGKNCRFSVFTVVVVLKIDRFFVYIGQKEGSRLVHAYFGISHRGGVIAVHGAKVALTIQQGQRHRKILRHTHECIVDRGITVRVIFTHHVAYSTGGLAVAFLVIVARFVHRVKNAAVDRFQAISQVGNRT